MYEVCEMLASLNYLHSKGLPPHERKFLGSIKGTMEAISTMCTLNCAIIIDGEYIFKQQGQHLRERGENLANLDQVLNVLIDTLGRKAFAT